MEQGIQEKCTIPAVKDSGCYFICLMEWALRTFNKEHDVNIDFSVTTIEQFYKELVELGYIQKDCYVENPVKILRLIAPNCSFDADMCIKKTMYKPTAGAYIICNKRPMYTHFTLLYGGKTWDPLNPDRAAAKLYMPDSYRILTKEGTA
jgi:hypothetical protein